MKTKQELNPLISLLITPEAAEEWRQAGLRCGTTPQILARQALAMFAEALPAEDWPDPDKPRVRFVFRAPAGHYEAAAKAAEKFGERPFRFVRALIENHMADILRDHPCSRPSAADQPQQPQS